jgi:hypothetical protein
MSESDCPHIAKADLHELEKARIPEMMLEEKR